MAGRKGEGHLRDASVPTRSVDPLHRIEQAARFVDIELVQCDHVGMIQTADHARFGQEAFPRKFVRSQFVAQHFDRDLAIDRALVGLVHDARAAASESADDAIVQIGSLLLRQRADAPQR